MYSIRKYQDSLVMDLNKPVHPDNIFSQAQVVPTVKIVATDPAIVDEEKYSEFVRRTEQFADWYFSYSQSVRGDSHQRSRGCRHGQVHESEVRQDRAEAGNQ